MLGVGRGRTSGLPFRKIASAGAPCLAHLATSNPASVYSPTGMVRLCRLAAAGNRSGDVSH
jgi:hypothetical protein